MKTLSEILRKKKSDLNIRVNYYHDRKDHAGHDSYDHPYDARRRAHELRRRGYKVTIQNLRK
jgi:hypothetical protein